MTTNDRAEKVLEVEDLNIAYKTRNHLLPAVRQVSFTINRGETIGIVGESGCGKSTVAFGIVNFLGQNGRITGGSVKFEGSELVGRSQKELNRLRGDRIAMVYQDPMAALNPTVRIGQQLAEVLTAHRDITWDAARKRCVEMLNRVHMPDAERVMDRYAHQLSGGQQQRVVIAMAMLNEPALLIMDEPTTALDVTVEATVLDLVEDLKSEFSTGILFISHNLGVVARVSDKLCVMYAGEVVEKGAVGGIFRSPAHPYTMGLLSCVPKLGTDKAGSQLNPIRGRVPAIIDRPRNACIFQPRCDFAADLCVQGRPALTEVQPGHVARCFFGEKVQRSRGDARRAHLKVAPKAERDVPSDPLLTLEGLKVYYEQESRSLASLFGMGEPQFVRAVDDISFTLSKGKTLGIVGESGCGKSTLVKGVIGLERITGGNAEFLSVDIRGPVRRRERKIIKEMQMVFQNPDATLNPSYPVGKQIARPIRRFKTVAKDEVYEEVVRLLRAVRLGKSYYKRYPRQLSGGEKQRVGIARALASRPDLVICDEPVSALDVSVQAAVLNLLIEIQQSFGATIIFIAHDLSVVRYLSDWVAVMYLGRIVEIGPAASIYAPPYHPYSEALLSAVPIPDPDARQRHIRLDGNVPSAMNPPAGCHFHTRCPRRREMLPDHGKLCQQEKPPWRKTQDGHRILCHIPLEKLMQNDDVINA